jgi:hypothetical protein
MLSQLALRQTCVIPGSSTCRSKRPHVASATPALLLKVSSLRIHIPRRALLSLLLLTPTLPALADGTPPVTLPKAYTKTTTALISALRDSISADLTGDNEREVRRKADPAKHPVRESMGRWQGELGTFYASKGQRARLDNDLGKELLDRLDAAELALPKEDKKSLFPF